MLIDYTSRPHHLERAAEFSERVNNKEGIWTMLGKAQLQSLINTK